MRKNISKTIVLVMLFISILTIEQSYANYTELIISNNYLTIIDTSLYIPKLIIDTFKTTNEEAGEVMEVVLTIKNNSSQYAKDIYITPIIDDIQGLPFILENQTTRVAVADLTASKTVDVKFNMRIKDAAIADVYAVKFKMDFVNAFGNSFTTTEAIYIGIKNSNTIPLISVSNIILQPQTLEAGEATKLMIRLKNQGTLPARELKLSLEGLDSKTFTIVNGTNTAYQSELRGLGEANFFFDLHASDQMTKGNHSLTLKASYMDQQNKSYTEEFTFFIPVGGVTEGKGDIRLGEVQGPNGELSINDSFAISFDVENAGTAAVSNVKVRVDGGEKILPRSQNLQMIHSLDAGAKKNMAFSFYVDSEAKAQNHPILIEVEYDAYEYGNVVTKKITQYYGVLVSGSGGKAGTPKIIIDKYELNPTIVQAGDTFDIAVSFLNTNKLKSVNNVKIYLTVNETTNESGSAFTPVNSSNTFFIDSIAPRTREEKILTLYTIPDAKPKTYTVTVNFEYEDNEGKEYTATELIGIPVVQQSRLEVNDFVLPPELPLGNPLQIFLEFYNMGKVTLNNLVIKLEGNFETQNRSYFVGNFEAGSSEYYEAMIFPTELGKMEGNIVFSYEDAAGEAIELIKPFELNVIEMINQFPEEGMDIPMEPPQQSMVKRILTSKLFWGAFAVIAVAVGVFVYRKKIKKRKELEEDEAY